MSSKIPIFIGLFEPSDSGMVVASHIIASVLFLNQSLLI
jgi:hypothetical protein